MTENYYMTTLGVDGKIHCCDVQDKERSSCETRIKTRETNPDFNRMPYDIKQITWCYECSSILERQEEVFNGHT